MKIAIYGRQFNNNVLPHVQQVFDSLAEHSVETFVYDRYNHFISGKIFFPRKNHWNIFPIILLCLDKMHKNNYRTVSLI